MRRSPPIHGKVPLLLCLQFLFVCSLSRAYAQLPEQLLVVHPASPGDHFAAETPNPSNQDLQSVVPIPASQTPLSGTPYVFTLDRRTPAQMSADDTAVVSSLSPELSKEAALASFDLAEPGWQYQQIVCPAFPDYLFLDFSHGADPNGSSHFVAALARNGPQVRIVSSAAHGFLPFESAWNKPGTYDIFNHILLQERGSRSMKSAPNWLVIGMCYAELSGHHVQVLTPKQLTGASMDLTRLKGVEAQMLVGSDQSATVTFSDASKPGVTTLWALKFDRHGQLTSVSHDAKRQPAGIALRPEASSNKGP